MPKYQLSIGAIILSLLVPLAITHAAYTDVVLTTDTILTVGGYTLTVSGSSASLESIAVGTSDFSVVVPAGSTVTIASASRQSFTVDGVPSTYVTKTCSDTASTLVVAAPSGGGDGSPTALIIPSATTCTTATASGSVSSGGSGGGAPGPATVRAPVILPVLAVVPGCPTGVVCTPVILPTQASLKAVANVSKVFTKRLVQGNTSDDVRRLQTLLASDPSIYPGGQVTGYFGKLTRKAVENFQIKYKIAKPGDEGFGIVGPKTRASLKTVFEK